MTLENLRALSSFGSLQGMSGRNNYEILDEMCALVSALGAWGTLNELSVAAALSRAAVSRATTRGRFCLAVSVGYRGHKMFKILPGEELRFCWLAWPAFMGRLQPDVVRYEFRLAVRLRGPTLTWQQNVHRGEYVLLPMLETPAQRFSATLQAIREDLEREDLDSLRGRSATS
jgi:hypothetical protein